MLNRLIIALWLAAQKQEAHWNVNTSKQTTTFYHASPLYRVTLGVWAILYNLQARLTD